jgi:rhamnose utilization protein RhaD (predicted bifunctional aldolase and dehydrogenase)
VHAKQQGTMNGLAGLIAFSKRLGSDPLLAPGSSGNTSLKTEHIIWIKASGKALRNSAGEETFVPVNINSVFESLAWPSGIAVCENYPTSLRPSIETYTHVLMPQPVVAHLHGVNTVAWSVRQDGIDLMRDRMEGLRWTWIPYALSGRDLALAILSTPQCSANVLVLANHGFVVAGESFAEVEALVDDVEERLYLPPRMGPDPDLRALRRRIDIPGWRIPSDAQVHTLATDARSFELAVGGILYPCQFVYLSGRLGLMGAAEGISQAVTRHERLWGCKPAALLAPFEGLALSSDANAETQEQLTFLAQVLARIDAQVRVRELSSGQIADLQKFEMRATRSIEQARQHMSETAGAVRT